MPDITESLAPKSDQLDAVDLTSGPRDFTITQADYRPGTEQPVTVHLAEFDRPWKPGKNMRRVMASCLTTDTDNWPGHRIRLFCNPEVVFAGVQVGGIQVSHIDIEKPTKVPLILSKGKSVMYPVKTLPKAGRDAPAPSPAIGADTMTELLEMFDRKGIPSESRLAGVNHITGGSATDLEAITEDDARKVLATLSTRPDVTAEDAFPTEATS